MSNVQITRLCVNRVMSAATDSSVHQLDGCIFNTVCQCPITIVFFFLEKIWIYISYSVNLLKHRNTPNKSISVYLRIPSNNCKISIKKMKAEIEDKKK